MGMRITRLAEAAPFDPPGHEKVGPVRLLDASAAGEQITVSLSHYLPGGRADTAAQPAETVYVVIAGELEMTSEDVSETLGPYDCAHFTAGTVRRVANRTNLPASMLVIRPANP
ncbi:MAG TPA: cupin domain-containing protein [Actinospica sp.]|jgi:mannose-6-phosphate isomerase-like protein (cupin superfamily)|nr:cupin domain-containing protein [Actinospica sp.]